MPSPTRNKVFRNTCAKFGQKSPYVIVAWIEKTNAGNSDGFGRRIRIAKSIRIRLVRKDEQGVLQLSIGYDEPFIILDIDDQFAHQR